MRPILEPAVDTPQKRGFGNSVESLYFSAICRTLRSGGTRIRTGDTMIFSHMQKPLGMLKTRVGKRIYVRSVSVGTTWFCPYCCATVDTSFVLEEVYVCSPTADCDDIDPYARHKYTPRFYHALNYGSESR